MKMASRVSSFFIMLIFLTTLVSTPAFCAGTFSYDAEARVLKDLGLYNGISSTAFNPDLGTALDRETGVVMLLRIFGLEAEALAKSDADISAALAKYTDASKIDAWAKKQVAYAVKNGLLTGTSNTTLSPKAALNGKAYCTMILRQLGYSPNYNNAPAELAGKGGLNPTEAVKFTSKNLIKDDLVGISFGTLKATDKDGKKVIDNLVAAKAVPEKAAADAGLINPAPGNAPVPLNIDNAVTINSKVVEVTLATAAAKSDLSGVAVKDSTGKDIAVAKIEFAPWATDGKDILVTLGSDTTAGSLYTLTAGTKTVNFGGKVKDTDKPIITKMESSDYNKVAITFSEPVVLGGAVAFAEKYGNKAVLASTAIAYSDRTTLTVATADQKVSTLYGAAISGFTDLAGNTMDKDDTKTFIGMVKSTDKQSVSEARAIDYNKVFVLFGVDVDTARIASATLKVEEVYGAKAVVGIGKITAATEADASDAGYTDSTAVTKANAAKRGVVINLTGELKNSTLYKVTAAGFYTLYGQPMSSADADTNKTFIGTVKPGADSLTYTAPTAVSNTRIEINFANKLDAVTAANTANYAIAEAYAAKTALAVTKAEVDNAKVTLTVASMKNALYKITITGLKDVYGNSIKTSGDSNIQTFIGKASAARISSINSAVLDSAGSVLTLTFDQNPGASLTDISHYSISGGVGYPTRAYSDDASVPDPKVVKLAVTKTTEGVLYTISVKGLENSDGVPMDTAGISATFAGKGSAVKLPEIDGVIADNKNTLQVYFDRSVTDSTIDGVIWNSSTGSVDKFFTFKQKMSSPGPDLIAGTSLAAFKDPSNGNVLDIVSSTGDIFAKGTGYSSFIFEISAGSDNGVPYKNEVGLGDVLSMEVPAALNDYIAPKVTDVVGIDAHTAKVFFSKPVASVSGNVAIKVTSSGAALTVGAAVPVSGTNYMEWLIPVTQAMSNVSYKATFTTAGITDKYATSVKLDDEDTTVTNAPLVKEFAGNGSAADYLTDIYAIMTNNRTIEVHYPEAMQYISAIVDNTQATSLSAHNNVDNTGNYLLKKVDGTTALPGITPAIKYVEYDTAANIATLYLNGDIDTTVSSFGLVVNTYIKNITGNKSVEATSASTDKDLTIQVAKNAATADPGPAISSVKIAGDKMSLDITMDRPTAVDSAAKANLGVAGGNTITSKAKLPNKTAANGLANALSTAADFIAVFDLNARFANESANVDINSTSNFAAYINSVDISADGKTYTVNFKKAIAAGTTGYVSTKTSSAADMYLYSYAFAPRSHTDNESKIAFAAP